MAEEKETILRSSAPPLLRSSTPPLLRSSARGVIATNLRDRRARGGLRDVCYVSCVARCVLCVVCYVLCAVSSVVRFATTRRGLAMPTVEHSREPFQRGARAAAVVVVHHHSSPSLERTATRSETPCPCP